jgi:hypothetical protein
MVGVKRLTWRSPYSTFFLLGGFLSKALPTMCNSKLHWDKNFGKFVPFVGEKEKKQAQMECASKVSHNLTRTLWKKGQTN